MGQAKRILVLVAFFLALAVPMLLYILDLLVLWKAAAVSFFLLMFIVGLFLGRRYARSPRALATLDIILGGGMALSYFMAAVYDGLDYGGAWMILLGLAILIYGLYRLRMLRNARPSTAPATLSRTSASAQPRQP